MNPNLKTAIIEFVANEFHLNPEAIDQDTNFETDLNLSPEEISDLLQRLQDALSFIISDEKISDIYTIGDIVTALTSDKDTPNPEEPLV